jgi:hypothetical protein
MAHELVPSTSYSKEKKNTTYEDCLHYYPTINSDLIDNLQKLVGEFIKLMASTNDDESTGFYGIVRNITYLIYNKYIDDDVNSKLCKALDIIRKISTQYTEIWESDGSTQKPTKTSLATQLLKTLDKNFHTIKAKCNNYDAKMKKCKHDNLLVLKDDDSGEVTDQHIFMCDFHKYDSLSIHLVLACITNMQWAVDKKLDEDVIMRVGLMGLYHDIGKMMCVETYEFKNSMMTGFPAHAEIGAMIFQINYSTKMNTYISETDYMNISTAILHHMCGYHGDENESNAYKRDLLLLDQPIVRNLLTINRVGDHFGKLPETSDCENPEHFLKQQVLFGKRMASEKEFNFNELVKTHYNKNGKIHPNKVILYLIGTSGAGKTHLVEVLKKTFPQNVTHISRDEVVASVCVSIHKRLEGEDYTRMYKIYSAGKNVSSFLRAKKLEKNELVEFEKAKIELSTAQTEWNEYVKVNSKEYPEIKVYDHSDKASLIPNISNNVQNAFMKEISDGLADDKFYVAIDTFMNCFPMAIENNVPRELSNYFRVHIHVQSYLERTSTTIAASVKDQLKVSGPYGLDNLIHPDGFGGYKNAKTKKFFASLSSEIGTIGPLPRSTFATKFRPNYVAGIITRTPETPKGLGYEELLNCLERLIGESSIKKKIDCDTIIVEKKIKESTKSTKSKESKGSNESKESKSADTEALESDPDADGALTFGIDPKTKDFNVVEMYSHLVKEYDQDISRIRDFLRTLGGSRPGSIGFMHSTPLGDMFEVVPDTEKASQCEKLALLNKFWIERKIVKNRYSVDDFSKNSDIYNRYIGSIVILKYFEQYGARFWQNKWAKEMRGTILFVNPDTREITILSFKLPRGAEVYTGMIKNKGIDTQDVKAEKTEILDEEQRDTCTRLCTNKDINVHLTSKGDGSLLVINCFTKTSIDIVEPIVSIYGNEYIKLWAKQSLKITKGKRLLIPSTQGTFMEGGFMAPYMVTAMLVGSNIVSRKELETMENEFKFTHEDIWLKYGESWIKQFMRFRFFDKLTNAQTFCFEAICKNRTGLFGDRPHVELACSYERDRLIFLGTSLCERRFYIPHSVYEEHINKNIPFEVPIWWNITHASQVNAMMTDIDNLLRGKMSKKDYLTKYPPANSNFDCKDPECIEKAIIDFEGWVAMKICNSPIVDSDHKSVTNKLHIPLTVYSKIKTNAYYISHKFHEENISSLIELGKACSVFPLATKLVYICKSGEITRRLENVKTKILKLLDFKDPDNKVLILLKDQFEKSLERAKKEKFDANGKKIKIPKDPFVNFDKRTFDIQCKIVLNIKGFNFGSLLRPIYLEEFPEIDLNTPDLESTLYGITMHLQPWSPEYDNKIKDISPFSSSVRGLIVACLGSDFI